MATLRVGIASYGKMTARTMRIARGEERPGSDDPKAWFASVESFARTFSGDNRDLPAVIAERRPSSIGNLARATGRTRPDLSRTLRKLAALGLVRMEPDGRRRKPRALVDRVALDLPLVS